jgi:hypothetical protein
VSVENDYDVNSLAVPRRAKEAIGAIALLHNEVLNAGLLRLIQHLCMLESGRSVQVFKVQQSC